jgi:hypothetical protein
MRFAKIIEKSSIKGDYWIVKYPDYTTEHYLCKEKAKEAKTEYDAWAQAQLKIRGYDA